MTSHHHYSTCHRHPTKSLTGLCAACLRERLSGIDSNSHQETTLLRLTRSRSSSSSTSSTTTTTTTTANPNAASSSSSSSTTTTTTTTTTIATQPRRKSCDIRPQNSLSDLFVIDDDKTRRRKTSKTLSLGSELKEEEENGVGEVETSANPMNVVRSEDVFDDVVGGDLKTMKEFIDLEVERRRPQGKGTDFRVFAGTLWGAASGFSKKLGVLQRKQRMRKKDEVGGEVSLRKLREVQSELGEYGFLGRRSCDTASRLSVDVGRLSVDDSRYAFECEPGRASWDGCLIGGRAYPKLTPLVSVVEDVRLGNEGVVDLENDEEGSPGGTVQTMEYYSVGRRQGSFDRSGSNRRVGFADGELKLTWNAKVSPEGVGLFHGAKVLVTEKELRDSNWYLLKGSSIDSIAKDAGSVAGGEKALKPHKAQRLGNMWNILGFMQRKNRNKFGDDSSSISTNIADGDQNGTISQKLIRSYAVSAKGSGSSFARNVETEEKSMKQREELVLQRNLSTRYPYNPDSGLLRFYLTPSRNNSRISQSARNSVSHARNDL